MPTEIVMHKTSDGSFRPSTVADIELAGSIKQGAALKFTAVKMSARALKHHQKYFAGLLNLGMAYWQQSGGLITPTEKSTLLSFAEWLDGKGKNTGAIRNACREFLIELRGQRIDEINLPETSLNSFHVWIKIEAGWFDWVRTPAGMIQVPRSINFNSMSQEEFEQFYKAAFDVIWRFVLSRQFQSEQDAENAVAQLLSMG